MSSARSRLVLIAAGTLATMAWTAPAMAAGALPACRLDGTNAAVVKSTIARAAAAYKQLGRALPFQAVSVNAANVSAGTLSVYIVKDADKEGVNATGCATRAVTNDDELDDRSVRGGCVLTSADAMEIRCSAQAVSVFSDVGSRRDIESPALLYVLSHELGHLYQKQAGEYSGRAEVIDLSDDRAHKLSQLQSSCDPVSSQNERQADEFALDVLKLSLSQPPYREPTFTERGSVYWNIDLLALASQKWTEASLQREFISRPKLHKSFEPTEFPTSQPTVKANAHRFVCDVLTKKNGRILYPGKSTSHPPVETRLQRIAEVLRPVAQALPNTGGSTQFAPVARLQGDLSPIFTQIPAVRNHASSCSRSSTIRGQAKQIKLRFVMLKRPRQRPRPVR